MLMSPWIPKNTAIQRPSGPTPTSQYDLTSGLATAKNLFNLSTFLCASLLGLPLRSSSSFVSSFCRFSCSCSCCSCSFSYSLPAPSFSLPPLPLALTAQDLFAQQDEA